MATPSNLSFETAGATTGSALGWVVTPVSSASVIGTYAAAQGAASRKRRRESFSGGFGGASDLVASFASNGTAVLSSAGHPFTVDDEQKRKLTLILTGTPPSPLNASTGGTVHGAPDLSRVYYLVSVVPGVSFGLSDEQGGSPLVVSAGVGTVKQPTNEFYIPRFVAGSKVAGAADSFNWHASYIFGPQQEGNLTQGRYSTLQVPPSGIPSDGFFIGWGLDGYRSARITGDVTAGSYDASPAQRFGKWLASLTGYRETRDPGDVTAASFDSAAARSSEKFIAVRDAEWAATAGSVELESHDPPMVGSAVYVSTTDTLPGGFAVDTAYAVVNRSGSTFRLATGPSHPAIAPTTTGVGTHSLTAADGFCWRAE